ncbi:hypothetical protein ACM66B_003219 [Microbotryomycetes sp. NB124-2]
MFQCVITGIPVQCNYAHLLGREWHVDKDYHRRMHKGRVPFRVINQAVQKLSKKVEVMLGADEVHWVYVLGPFSADGVPLTPSSNKSLTPEQMANIKPEDIRCVKGLWNNNLMGVGEVEVGRYTVSTFSGACMALCSDKALELFQDATGWSAYELWRLVQSHNQFGVIGRLPHELNYDLPLPRNFNDYELEECFVPFPGYSKTPMVGSNLIARKLAQAGCQDVGAAVRELINNGGFWRYLPFWLQVCREPETNKAERSCCSFPTGGNDSSQDSYEAIAHLASLSLETKASLDGVPFDVFVLVAQHAPLATLAVLQRVSKRVQAHFLTRSNRNTIAHAWLNSYGRFWKPQDNQVANFGWWAYLQRCARSGSMRNRKRIWFVSKRIAALRKE